MKTLQFPPKNTDDYYSSISAYVHFFSLKVGDSFPILPVCFFSSSGMSCLCQIESSSLLSSLSFKLNADSNQEICASLTGWSFSILPVLKKRRRIPSLHTKCKHTFHNKTCSDSSNGWLKYLKFHMLISQVMRILSKCGRSYQCHFTPCYTHFPHNHHFLLLWLLIIYIHIE